MKTSMIEDWSTVMANYLLTNFSNLGASQKKTAKEKLGIGNLATYGDLPTLNVKVNDFYYVTNASGDPEIETAIWAIYWCTNDDPITWNRIIDENGNTSLSGNDIISLINGASSTINLSKINTTGYTILTDTQYSNLINSISEKLTSIDVESYDFGFYSAYEDWNGNTALTDIQLTTDINYINGEVPIININDMMISPSRYSIVDADGKLAIKLHCKELHSAPYTYIEWIILQDYPVTIYYPKL